MKHIIRTFLWFTITLGWVGFARSDEIGERSLLVLTQYSGGLRFDLLKLDGTRAELWDLSNQFAIGDTGDAEWVIISSRQIRVSPSGNALSWTAFKSGDLSQSALFVLDLERKILKQTDVQYPGEVQWSPDETKILLSLPVTVPDEADWQLSGNFVFDITNLSPTRISDIADETLWLGDSQRLLNAPGGEVAFIAYADREEVNRFVEIYRINPRNFCSHVWSEVRQALFLIEGCPDIGGAEVVSQPPILYSVSLTGDIQLEGSIGNLLLSDSSRVTVFGVYENAGEIFVALRTYEDPTPDPFDVGDEILRFRLANLTTSQDFVTIYTDDNSIPREVADSLQNVSFSPDGVSVALGFNDVTRDNLQIGRLVVVNTETGGSSFEVLTDSSICDLTWINTFTIAYSQNLQSVTCSTSSGLPASHITLADLTSETTQNISINQEELVWLIPIPDSAVLPNPDIVLPDR